MYFIHELKSRNEPLFWFGAACFLAGIVFIVLSFRSGLLVAGVNAWYKPVKFALSIAAYSWTMAWLIHYLPQFNVRFFNWAIIVLLGFALFYIALQAGRGKLSHYNQSSGLYSMLYMLMAFAATAVTVYTAYAGFEFFRQPVNLPPAYLNSIRAGIFIFVIFSLEGFVMGSRLSHTIGGADGNHGIAFLGWSRRFGDPRVAHFIGMHALQVLPLLGWYVLRESRWVWLVAGLYFVLAVFTLIQALRGRPFFREKSVAVSPHTGK
ncbi:MAG: hypothetical protein MUC87_20600 [Bacteroidia bacterium]|jgi:hypothetical protein|nr:hypothetical protein [Bacteroidia bacterium]